jgi:hypothetical protein
MVFRARREHRGSAADRPHLLEEEEEAHGGSGCGVLQGEDRTECMNDRQQRAKAREHKAVKLQEDEAAIEDYKRRRRAEKKLKGEQQAQELQRQARQKEQEERAERDTQKQARAQMQKQFDEEQQLEANPELASLSELERRIWFLRQKVGGSAPPLPPSAGGEYAPWNNSKAWQRFAQQTIERSVYRRGPELEQMELGYTPRSPQRDTPISITINRQVVITPSFVAELMNKSWVGSSPCGGPEDLIEDAIDWFPSHGVNLTSLSLAKKEYGHLAKKREVCMAA